jgi:hypothetical protein
VATPVGARRGAWTRGACPLATMTRGPGDGALVVAHMAGRLDFLPRHRQGERREVEVACGERGGHEMGWAATTQQKKKNNVGSLSEKKTSSELRQNHQLTSNRWLDRQTNSIQDEASMR